MEKYEIWRTGILDDEPREKVGEMYSEELARDFVEYQATLGESFVIKHNGEVLELD